MNADKGCEKMNAGAKNELKVDRNQLSRSGNRMDKSFGDTIDAHDQNIKTIKAQNRRNIGRTNFRRIEEIDKEKAKVGSKSDEREPNDNHETDQPRKN